MGRFPWGQGHSKQSSDKLHAIPHDWFSKDKADSSRPGLTNSIREHSFGSGASDGSPIQQGRSRTNTITSAISFYARSVSDVSNDLTSRPSSRQSSAGSSLPSAERFDKPAENLLSKGSRILRRQGSKFSLLSSTTEEKSTGVGEIAGQTSPIKGLQRHPTLSSQRHDFKRSISNPFAFQHLTHGDQAHFQSLDNVTKTELTSEFIAAQSHQQPDDHIRGIPVTDLPAQGCSGVCAGLDEPTSPTTSAIPYLPRTPPRPQPPPKDGFVSPYSSSEIRLSRSIENFSRPTRSSMVASDLPSPSAASSRLSDMRPTYPNNVSTKPLPQLPNVVHAVSTTDDIALPLPTAPLPSPPKNAMEAVEEETAEQTSTRDIRTPPPVRSDLASPVSSIQRRRRSQSSGEIDFAVAYYTTVPDMESQEASSSLEEESQKLAHPISFGMKGNQLEDWEEAIDESWDHPVELEDVKGGSETVVDQSTTPNLGHDNCLVVEQQNLDEPSSSASTPLMMMQRIRKPHELNRSGQQSGPSRRPYGERESVLLGLGLESVRSLPAASCSQPDMRQVGRPDSEDGFCSNLVRTPNSAMSKSSSQESIILSIASSIIGTQRSSNSSTSLSDFTHLVNFGGAEDSLKVDYEAPSYRAETRIREGSQDTIREESQTHAASTNATLGTQFDSSTNMSDSPTRKHHDRGASAPQVFIPERKSSMPCAEYSPTHTGRKRAGTAASRPRGNTRGSYSLFPTPSPR